MSMHTKWEQLESGSEVQMIRCRSNIEIMNVGIILIRLQGSK